MNYCSDAFNQIFRDISTQIACMNNKSCFIFVIVNPKGISVSTFSFFIEGHTKNAVNLSFLWIRRRVIDIISTSKDYYGETIKEMISEKEFFSNRKRILYCLPSLWTWRTIHFRTKHMLLEINYFPTVFLVIRIYDITQFLILNP